MTDKTKAAWRSRQCHYGRIDRDKNTTSSAVLKCTTILHHIVDANKKAAPTQNKILKNDTCASERKAGNSANLGRALFHGCLLVASMGGYLTFLRWRRLISPRMEVTINPALLSPSSFKDSISDTTSCGTRTVKSCDFAFLLEVAITDSFDNWCVSVYAKKNYIQCLKCVSLECSFKSEGETHLKSAKPGSAGTLTGPLTTNVIRSNAMATANSNTLAHSKFTWRFLALSRSDRKAKPCRVSVEAATEREARRVLAPHFILSLSARLPVSEVSHV